MNNQDTIRRARHSSQIPWFQMRRATAQDANLSFEARGMLAYLLSKPDDWDVRISDLQREGGCGRDRIYRIINELVAARYISERRQFKDDDGRFQWTPYLVYEEPYTENPYTENPYTENTDVLHKREVHKRDDNTAAPPSNDFTDLPLPDDDDPTNPDLSRLHEAYRTKINSAVPYTLAVSLNDYVETHGIEAMLRAVEYCQKLGGKSKTAFLRIAEATAPITDKEMLDKALKMAYEKASGNDRTAYFARVLEGLREMRVMPEPKPAPRPRYIDAQAALADVELDYDD